MSLSSRLYRLQQIDSQHDQAQARLREIDALLQQNSAIAQAQQLAEQARAALQTAAKTLKQAEALVQDQRIKIETAEASLYGGKIRNPKELQDLQHDAASLKRHLAVLEDRQLDAMLALEEAELIDQKAESALEEARGQVSEQQAALKGEQTALLKLVDRFGIERQVALSPITAAEIGLYEQLRQQRRGIAVSKVSGKSCDSCGATLTPAVVQSACSPSQLVRCPSCGRILFAG